MNFEKREIRLRNRKTRDGSLEGEWLPMNDDLYREMNWLWNNRPFKENLQVFVDTNPGQHHGKPYKVRRRFVASMLADKHKQSSKTVQRFLRHKHVRTTELYIQNINNDLKSVVELLNQDEPANEIEEKTVDPK